VSIELTYLIWSPVLLGLYLGAQSLAFRAQFGVLFASGARDEEPRLNVFSGRADRALRNFLETYAAFIALAVATELSGRSDALTQWGTLIYFWARVPYLGLYLAGVPYVRSLVWLVSAVGLCMLFFGVAF